MPYIDLGITQFVRPVGGSVIPKVADMKGGGYQLEDLPRGVQLEVVSSGTHDQVGAFRSGLSNGVLFSGTREEIAKWNTESNGW
jgi:hypothetical protein